MHVWQPFITFLLIRVCIKLSTTSWFLILFWLEVQVEYPLSETFGNRNISNFRFLNMYMYIKSDIQGMEPKSKHECFICILHSLRVILCHIFSATAFDYDLSPEVSCKFRIQERFRFWISWLGMLNQYTMEMMLVSTKKNTLASQVK